MAKKKAAPSKTRLAKPTKKAAEKKPGKKPRSPSATKPSRSTMPGVKALAAAGAKAVTVQFHGFGDDGAYEFGVLGGGGNLKLDPKAESELEQLLDKNCSAYGDGPGSVLFGRFDLVKSEFRGFSGGGEPHERLAELVGVLAMRGISKVTGELTSRTFKKCAVEPHDAMTREEASQLVASFFDRVDYVQCEYGDAEDEEGELYDAKEFALLDHGKGVLTIDVPKRRVTWARAKKSESVEFVADKLDETRFSFRVS